MPELSEPPPPRRRVLSEEERALWDSVAKQTKPLRKKARHAKSSHGKTLFPPVRPEGMRAVPLPLGPVDTSRQRRHSTQAADDSI